VRATAPIRAAVQQNEEKMNRRVKNDLPPPGRAGAAGKSVTAAAKPPSSARQRGHGPAIAAKTPELRKQVETQALEIAQLKNRRVDELERLTQITKARDLLEARTAVQLKELAKLREELSEREKQIEQLDRRVGGARLLGQREPEPDQPDRTGWKALVPYISSRQWRLKTIREARRAHSKGRLVEAQILFDAALLGGETADMWVELGHVLRERELFEPAEWAYRRSLELKPRQGEVLFLRGFCLEKAGRKEPAARLYEEALAADPELITKYDHLRDYNTRLLG
jgi:tetratricopeptide (TPR) repeat protein